MCVKIRNKDIHFYSQIKNANKIADKYDQA